MTPRLLHVAFAISLLMNSIANAQSSPQCSLPSNDTSLNGTAGPEQHFNRTTVRITNAHDAKQGVAVDGDYLYSNYSVSKHNKSTDKPSLQWYDCECGPIIHVDAGVVIDGLLYAPHSNYPDSSFTTTVEVWNTTNMERALASVGHLSWIIDLDRSRC